MDTVQILLLSVVIVLTALLLLLGIQVYYILREIRMTIQRTNRIIDDVEGITASLSGGISSLSSLTTGLKAGAMVASIFKNIKRKAEEGMNGTA